MDLKFWNLEPAGKDVHYSEGQREPCWKGGGEPRVELRREEGRLQGKSKEAVW